MKTIGYFLDRYILSLLIGKPNKKMYDQLSKVIYLNIKCLLIFGYTLDELKDE